MDCSLVSQLIIEKLIEPGLQSIGVLCCCRPVARTEGSIPAPETSHAIQCVIEEAKKAKEEGKEKVILLNWSGHGLMDLGGYDSYFSGKLVDYLAGRRDEKILKSIEGFPKPKMMRKGNRLI